MLSHKVSLYKSRETENTLSTFSGHSGIKLELTSKLLNIEKLSKLQSSFSGLPLLQNSHTLEALGGDGKKKKENASPSPPKSGPSFRLIFVSNTACFLCKAFLLPFHQFLLSLRPNLNPAFAMMQAITISPSPQLLDHKLSMSQSPTLKYYLNISRV